MEVEVESDGMKKQNLERVEHDCCDNSYQKVGDYKVDLMSSNLGKVDVIVAAVVRLDVAVAGGIDVGAADVDVAVDDVDVVADEMA